MRRQTESPIPLVVGYLRVSSDDQVQHGHGLATQEQSIRDWCAREFGDTPYQLDLERDEGLSGKLGYELPASGRGRHRPGLARVVERLRAGTVDVLVVYDLSRMYRNFLEQLKFRSEFLGNSSSCRLVSVTEPVELSTIEGVLSTDVISVVAEYQRQQTARKVKHGLAQRRSEGYATGKPPYGWRRTKAENGGRPGIEPVPEQIHWVGEAFRLALAGHGTRQIAQEFNTKGAPTGGQDLNWTDLRVYRVLTKPLHAGLIRDGEGTRRGAHWNERVIEPEEFERVRALLGGRHRERHTYDDKELHVLWKLARCGDCGQPVTVIRVGGQHAYRCHGAFELDEDGEGEIPADGRRCRGWTKNGALIERRLLDLLQDAVDRPEFRKLAKREAREVLLNQDKKQATRRLREVDQALKENRARQRRLLRAFTLAQEHLDEELFAEQQQELAEAQRQWEEEQDRLQQRSQDRRSQAELLQRVLCILPRLRQVWEALTPDERRHLVANLTDYVYLERLGPGRLKLRVKVHFLPEWEVNLGNARSREMGARRGVEHLTQRELALLYWLEQGKSLKGIAELWQAHLSVVYRLRKSILERLDVARMRDAIRLARKRLRAEQDRLPLREVSAGRPGYAGYRPRQEQRMEQVLRLRAEGSSRAEIARELGLALETVRVYEWKARQHYGVETLKEAGAKFLEKG